MSKKIFVASLPFDYTDELLKTLFSEAGHVESAAMVYDPKHHRSRGFGFVVMPNDAEAIRAIELLNGRDVGDRKIWVTEARPRVEKPAAEGGWAGFGAPGQAAPARGARFRPQGDGRSRRPEGRPFREGGHFGGRRPQQRDSHRSFRPDNRPDNRPFDPNRRPGAPRPSFGQSRGPRRDFRGRDQAPRPPQPSWADGPNLSKKPRRPFSRFRTGGNPPPSEEQK